jgi:AmmeMemoRadiSam system protein A
MTSHDERRRLLRIARGALAAHLTGVADPVGELEEEAGGHWRLAGAFVTLRARGELRGCVGHIESDEPLARVVARCAVAAGNADPRFPAVTWTELSEVVIELSILGTFEEAAGPHDIEVGRHGLLVEWGRQRGLLLPQVAVEWSWDAQRFVAETCRKAGLALDAWTRGARVWRFEAEVFDER